MRRFLRKTSNATKTTSFISLLLGLAGLYVTFTVAVDKFASFDITKTEHQVLAVGFVVVLLILLQSLGQAIYGICWSEKRIVSNLGVSG